MAITTTEIIWALAAGAGLTLLCGCTVAIAYSLVKVLKTFAGQ